QKQRNCRYSNFPLFIGISSAQPSKAFNIKHFRQIQSRPKPPSKITKQPLTYKTRNQLCGLYRTVGSNPTVSTKKSIY
ncbi:MAG: hypothetical protein PUG88_02115, partial [Eubacterium coprostanoligenes]|uniref:hypothetical protein n=1 Tax=Eubacterium coprostanoligenes TaxID=290054 RepID=UPI0023F2F0EA